MYELKKVKFIVDGERKTQMEMINLIVIGARCKRLEIIEHNGGSTGINVFPGRPARTVLGMLKSFCNDKRGRK